MRATLVTVGAVVVLAACGATTVPGVPTAVAAKVTPSPSGTLPPVPPAPKPCTPPQGELPDPDCTPGAVMASVTQATIATTVCRKGWATPQHPPEVWTEALKQRMVRAYYPKGTSLTLFALDALIPVEIGGDHWSAANLWVEPKAQSLIKDNVEHAARAAVCRKVRPIPVAFAQGQMALDWVAFGRALGVRVS